VQRKHHQNTEITRKNLYQPASKGISVALAPNVDAYPNYASSHLALPFVGPKQRCNQGATADSNEGCAGALKASKSLLYPLVALQYCNPGILLRSDAASFHLRGYRMVRRSWPILKSITFFGILLTKIGRQERRNSYERRCGVCLVAVQHLSWGQSHHT